MARRFQYLSICICLCFSALVATTTLDAQPYAYVANNGGNTVAVINTGTYTVSASIPVPATPSGIAVTPDGSTVYVSSSYNNNVSAIRTSDNTIVATIPVGTNPTRLAISPNGALVYVVDYVTNQISVISHNTKTVVATIGVGFRPTFVAFSPDSLRAYVTNLFSSTVSVIDTGSNQVINTFPTGSFPTGVAVTADGLHLYVSNQGTNAVTVHDPSGTVQTTITGFVAPNALAIAPNGKVFVTNGNGAAVSVIDPATNTVIAKPSVGSLPTSVTINTAGTQALVANEYGFSLSVIDTSSYAVVHTVTGVGVYPMVVGMQPAAPGSSSGVGGGTVTCSYALSGSTSLPAGAGSGSFTVTAPNGCAWGATAVDSWLGTSSTGSGNGTVSYTYSANGGTASRPGTITVGGQNFVVTQAGVGFSPIRVNAGGAGFTDTNNNVWQADNGPLRNYSVTMATVTNNVPAIYQKAAYAGGTGLSYTFSVPNGTFSVTLHFAETYETAASRRLMNISINGQPVGNGSLDVFALVGANTAYSVTYPGINVTNGQIVITIAPALGSAPAMLSGLEITQ